MNRLIAVLFACVLASSFALALTGPINVGGTEYYVVTSSDPTEDSGAEVCAKLGLTCVGFTDTLGGACAANNPGAATATSLSGDESVFYCDGAPQTGVCAGFTNSCVSCPTCTVSTSCNSPITNLYRELYVECKAPQTTCPVVMFARDTDQFLNEISSLNTALGSCPMSLPSGASFLVGSGGVQVDITRDNGRVDTVSTVLSNKQITGVTKGASSCSQKISITESELDKILASRDRGAAFVNAYTNKQFSLSGCTVVRKVVNFFTQPLARFFIARNAPPPPAPTLAANCGGLGEQCNNRACQPGLSCASPRTFSGGRWVAQDYRCIDNSDFQSLCVGRGNTPPAWSCVLGAACR